MNIFKRICLIIIPLLISACGGGDGAPSNPGAPPTVQAVQGTLADNIVVIPESDASATSMSIDEHQRETLRIANPVGALASAKNGDIVALPASDAQGIPFGLTAKAARNADGSLSLQPAALEEVFTQLSIDFDTERDATQVGLIGRKGGYINLTQAPQSNLQGGLQYALCQTGLNAVVNFACKNGAFEGKIGLEHKVQVEDKEKKTKTWATLYAQVDVTKLKAKVLLDYDIKKYPGTGGFGRAMVNVSGEWGASVGIKLNDNQTTAEIPSWGELLKEDKKNIWDENTKIKFGEYFELSGLGGSDKNGLIPLGGFFVTPQVVAPFSGNMSATQLNLIKPGALIIWVYIDIHGNITLKGDMKFLKFNGAYVERGFDIKRAGDSSITMDYVNQQTNASLYAFDVKGSISASKNMGLAMAADLLVGGTRPFTIKSELIGANIKGTVDGEGALKIYPAPMGLEGTLCAEVSAEVYSDFAMMAAVKLKLDSDWVTYSGGFSQNYGPKKKVFANPSSAACVNSFSLPLKADVLGVNSADPQKSDVQFDFAEAYDNKMLRDQTGTWRLFLKNSANSVASVDVNKNSLGKHIEKGFASGAYQAWMQALSSSLKDSAGNALVIAESPIISFEVPQQKPQDPWLEVKLIEVRNTDDGADIIFDINSSSKLSAVTYQRKIGNGEFGEKMNILSSGGCPGVSDRVSICGGFANTAENHGLVKFPIMNQTQNIYQQSFVYSFCNDKVCAPLINVFVSVPAPGQSCGGGEPGVGGGEGVFRPPGGAPGTEEGTRGEDDGVSGGRPDEEIVRIIFDGTPPINVDPNPGDPCL